MWQLCSVLFLTKATTLSFLFRRLLLSNIYLTSVFFCWKNNHPRSSVPPCTIPYSGPEDRAWQRGGSLRLLPRQNRSKLMRRVRRKCFSMGKYHFTEVQPICRSFVCSEFPHSKYIWGEAVFQKCQNAPFHHLTIKKMVLFSGLKEHFDLNLSQC